MLHHPHQKSWCQLVRIFLGYLYAKTDYHLFLKIFQRNSKLVILDSVDIPGHTHLKLEETFDVYLKAKINFIFQVFEILQPYCRLFSLGNLGMPGYKHRKWYYQPVVNFNVSKGPFWALFPKFGRKRISLEKRALSVFKYFNYLPSCKNSEKAN